MRVRGAGRSYGEKMADIRITSPDAGTLCDAEGPHREAHHDEWLVEDGEPVAGAVDGVQVAESDRGGGDADPVEALGEGVAIVEDPGRGRGRTKHAENRPRSAHETARGFSAVVEEHAVVYTYIYIGQARASSSETQAEAVGRVQAG